jgi:GWxTD domain-containing protein
MTVRRISLVLSLGALSLWGAFAGAQEMTDNWNNWLDEVKPIITKSERAVFKTLQKEEERKTFVSFFWKVRDASPGTPENEFRTEYYSRRKYAGDRLGGADSDRGRIYIILGKPAERQDFAGLDGVVDCELWIYRGEGRSGLPPMMYLLFYRRDIVGEYRLYYPGQDTAVDILSPSARGARTTPRAAYKTLLASYPELAKATLAVIPEEADAGSGPSINSSGQTIGRIFTLPEREVERSYLMYFSAPAGTVDVSYSTREISGKADVQITGSRAARFLSYALMPDRISTAKTEDGFETAHLVFQLRIEDRSARTIHQQEKEIRLRLDGPKYEAMRRNKLVFSDFAPLIAGDFRVRLAFTNMTSGEFFTAERDVAVNDATPPLVVGYQVKDKKPESLLPFSLGPFKVLLDPRSIFSPRDSLEGLILSDAPPELLLVVRDGPGPSIAIADVSRQGEAFVFRQPLAAVAPGSYDLVVKTGGAEIFRRTLYVLSFEFEKPLVFERTEPLSYLAMMPFVLGQEYLNAGRLDEALASFEKLPPGLRTGATLPAMAQAHYQHKDYARVIELLEDVKVEKSYPVLILLGNSSLELRKLEQAAFYFEEVRKFGDTAEANNTLGAIYFSLGDKDKAKVYWDRAKKLERKAA